MFNLNFLTASELVQLGANALAIPPMIIGVSLLIFAKRNSNQIIKELNPTLINLIGFLVLTINKKIGNKFILCNIL
jgi:hypothetical protein